VNYPFPTVPKDSPRTKYFLIDNIKINDGIVVITPAEDSPPRVDYLHLELMHFLFLIINA